MHYERWKTQGDPGGAAMQRNRSATGLCKVPECERKHYGHGYCFMHLARVKKYGDPNAVKLVHNDPDRRFAALYQVAENGCWLWTGRIEKNGYARFTIGQQRWGAHRWSYIRHVGPIPDGFTVDHVVELGCTNRHCVNPAHLEAVTHAVNNARAPKIASTINAAKTHCIRGHEFTPENTLRGSNPGPNPGRQCRTCRNKRSRESARRRAALVRQHEAVTSAEV